MSTSFYEGLVTAPEEDRPLIFAFHGTGGDEHQFANLAGALVPGAGVVSPRGDVSENGAVRFFQRTAEGVYDMEDLALRTERMSLYIADMRAEFGPRPAYGFGYSNGANILASVVVQNPGLFDRVGLMHPLVTWSPQPQPLLKGRSILVTAGEHDPIAPLAVSMDLVAWLRAQGAETQVEVHDGGHELRQSEIEALGQLFAD